MKSLIIPWINIIKSSEENIIFYFGNFKKCLKLRSFLTSWEGKRSIYSLIFDICEYNNKLFYDKILKENYEKKRIHIQLDIIWYGQILFIITQINA